MCVVVDGTVEAIILQVKLIGNLTLKDLLGMGPLAYRMLGCRFNDLRNLMCQIPKSGADS